MDERENRDLVMFKLISLSFISIIMFISACHSIPSNRTDTHDKHPYEDISTADPDENPPAESYTPPESPLNAVEPEYEIDDIPSVPQSVRGYLYRRAARNWQHIVIHHSGTATGSMESFDRHARENLGWKGVGYHFVIGNGHGSPDGMVEVTFRWERQIHGAHAGVRQYNEHGIGICLVGDFNAGYPTEKQIRALASLTSFLQKRNNIPTSEIYLHRHVKNTACPGENFPFYKFISLLRH